MSRLAGIASSLPFAAAAGLQITCFGPSAAAAEAGPAATYDRPVRPATDGVQAHTGRHAPRGHPLGSGSEADRGNALDEVVDPLRFSLLLRLGASYQRLYSVPFVLGELEFAPGFTYSAHAGYFTFRYGQGQSEQGLAVRTFHTGYMMQWSSDGLRVGGQLRLGTMTIERATNADNLNGLALGMRTHVSADVVSFAGTLTCFSEIALLADYYDPWVLGGGLSLGLRWDVGDDSLNSGFLPR